MGSPDGSGRAARRSGGGGADGGEAVLGADAVHGSLGGQPGLAGLVQADLLGDLVGVDEVPALEGEAGQAASLQGGGVHQLVGQGAQVLVVCGGLGQAAGLLPAGAAGEAESQSEGAGRLAAAAQQCAELDDEVEQGGADGGAVEGVPVEGMAYAGRGGQGAGNDGSGVDPAGPVGGCASGTAAERTVAGGTAASSPTLWIP